MDLALGLGLSSESPLLLCVCSCMCVRLVLDIFLDYMNFSISLSVGKNAWIYIKPTIVTGGKI